MRAKTCLLVFLLFFALLRGNASNVAGSDWQYTCTGTPGIYKLRLTLYSTCNGPNPFCNNNCGNGCNLMVQVRDFDGIYSNSIFDTALLSLVSVTDLRDFLCPTATTKCTNNRCSSPDTVNGISTLEKFVFEGIINLNYAHTFSSSSCRIRFSYNICCRSASINSGSAGQAFYTECMLDRCVSVCNNSPTFNNEPVSLICSGFPFIHNYGAYDRDGDSLSYLFDTSLVAMGQSVNYSLPYSHDAPMPWTGIEPWPPGGIHIHPVTGDITFKPGIHPFTGVMVVAVQQWRRIKGIFQLVGVTRRDMEITIVGCGPDNIPAFRTNPPPTSFPTAPRTSWEADAGQPLCFDVIAKDTDFNMPVVSDTTYVSWDSSIAGLGATFIPNYPLSSRTSSGPREDSFKFCWTPDDSCARKLPYYFTLKAKDARCPLPGITTKSFSVKVWPSKVHLSISKTDLHCNRWQIKYMKADSEQVFVSVQWNIAKQPFDWTLAAGSTTFNNVQTTPAISFSKAGKYLVDLVVGISSANNSTSVRTFRDTLFIDTPLQVTGPEDLYICKAISGKPFYAKRNKPAGVDWFALPNVRDTFSSGDTAFFTLPAIERTYMVRAIDYNNCMATDTFQVRLPVHASFEMSDSNVCAGYPVSFTNHTTSFFTIKKYDWLFDDGDSAHAKDVNHLYPYSGYYTATLVVTDTTGCSDSLSKHLLVNPKPAKPMISGDNHAKTHSTKLYTVFPHSGAQWTWLIQGDLMHSATGNQVAITWGNQPSTGFVNVFEKSKPGCLSDTSTLAVTIEDSLVGLPTLINKHPFSVYPNPADKELLLGFPGSENIIAKLFGSQGKLIFQYDGEFLTGHALPLGDIPEGLYLLMIYDENGSSFSEKVMIRH